MTNLNISLKNKNGGSGSHSVYFNDTSNLIIEWYDHGKNSPYESVNMLLFDELNTIKLSKSIGFEDYKNDFRGFLNELAIKIDNYFEAQEYCETNDIEFTKKYSFNT